MEILKKTKDKYLIFALFFALLNMGAVFFIFGFQRYGDSVGLLNTIHGFLGEGKIQAFPWILRPLGPFLAMPFEFLGTGAGLLVQNIVFYLLAVFLIFKIADLIYRNKQIALFASLAFATAIPVVQFGLSYLTDMGAWFFYIFSLFLTLLYLKNKNEGLVILNGFISGLGVLMKENGGLGILFFGLMILFSQEFSFKEKVARIIRFGIFFLIPVVLLQVLVFKYFHFTSLTWYLANKPSAMLNTEGWLLVSLRWLGQIFGTLGILWPFFFVGFWRQFRERNRERIKIYLALIPSSLSFLLWSVEAAGRSAFILAPLGVLLVGEGLAFLTGKFSGKKSLAVVTLIFIAAIAANYCLSWLNPRYQFVDIIAKFLNSQ
jgi:4-amino-4-deoxy-L-arabinose transferase-like glycosyltransferase